MTEMIPRWDERLGLARQDNAEVRGQLLDEQRDRLLRLAQQKLQGRVTVRVDPLDVVQETFLQAHRSFDQFQGDEEGAFRAWLDRILDNTITRALRNHLLLQKRTLNREQPLDDPQANSWCAGPQLDAGHTTPSQRAMRNEDEERLNRALEQLPDTQREAVRLRHLQGWSLAAIAEHLGRSTVATAALIKRGMESLRKHMDTEG